MSKMEKASSFTRSIEAQLKALLIKPDPDLSPPAQTAFRRRRQKMIEGLLADPELPKGARPKVQQMLEAAKRSVKYSEMAEA